jgi:hypothetical protein
VKLIAAVEKSGHWYTASGESAYGATLREARKENLYPSVTTVLNLIASPGLDAWKRTEAILAALTLPRNDGESLEDFAARVAIDMEQTASKAATIGTSIHDWIESYCHGQYKTPPEGYEAVCYHVQQWIDDNVDLKRSTAEGTIVNQKHGYAGRVDLQGYLLDGKPFISDWKTQNLKAGKKFVFYPKWVQQLAAYAMENDDVALVNIAVSSNKERPEIAERWWTTEEARQGWEVFWHCLKIWQAEKGYKPQ